jgi:uncharacterized protein (TIGR02246 family)
MPDEREGCVVSELEDVEEIRQLLARYCHYGDSLDSGAFAECFTEDAVLDAQGVRSAGREQIRQRVEAYRPIYVERPLRHVTANIVIDVDGDEARAASYIVLFAAGAQPSVLGTGTYHDRLRRVGGRWFFSERVATPDGEPSTPLPAGLSDST